jgi:hypothetical protein
MPCAMMGIGIFQFQGKLMLSSGPAVVSGVIAPPIAAPLVVLPEKEYFDIKIFLCRAGNRGMQKYSLFLSYYYGIGKIEWMIL